VGGLVRPIEFGLDTFGDVSIGSDGNPLSHAQVIRDLVDEAVLADTVGVDLFGVGEHHRPDFAVSAPEIVLAVIAGRTRHIRLASATTVLGCDDPVRVFQRFATLHAAAHGRVEVILGRGWFTEPFGLFGYDPSQYEPLFDEKLKLFAALLEHDTITWRGTTRPALTKQRVYPPIETGRLQTWVAVGASPQSVLRAAQYHLPMILAIVGGDPQRFKPFVELYHRAFEKLGAAAQAIGVHSLGYVAETDDRARDEYWPHYKAFRDRIGVERRLPPIDKRTFDVEVERGSLYVGSAETVAQRIAVTVKTLGLSRFQLKYSAGTLPHDCLLRSIELYGRQVVPFARSLLKA
jgi:probable LLM family oxidoreductase